MAKTTVDINASLLAEAKALAARNHTSLRETIEAALRAYLRTRPSAGFRIREASVDGRGLTADAASRPAAAWLDMAYEGRGA